MITLAWLAYMAGDPRPMAELMGCGREAAIQRHMQFLRDDGAFKPENRADLQRRLDEHVRMIRWWWDR